MPFSSPNRKGSVSLVEGWPVERVLVDPLEKQERQDVGLPVRAIDGAPAEDLRAVPEIWRDDPALLSWLASRSIMWPAVAATPCRLPIGGD
jgi:succinylarginine dihydrolase